MATRFPRRRLDRHRLARNHGRRRPQRISGRRSPDPRRRDKRLPLSLARPAARTGLRIAPITNVQPESSSVRQFPLLSRFPIMPITLADVPPIAVMLPNSPSMTWPSALYPAPPVHRDTGEGRRRRAPGSHCSSAHTPSLPSGIQARILRFVSGSVHDTLHCEQHLPQHYSTSSMHINLCNSEHRRGTCCLSRAPMHMKSATRPTSWEVRSVRNDARGMKRSQPTCCRCALQSSR